MARVAVAAIQPQQSPRMVDAQVVVLRKVLDAESSAALALLKSVSATPTPASTDTLGTRIDTHA